MRCLITKDLIYETSVTFLFRRNGTDEYTDSMFTAIDHARWSSSRPLQSFRKSSYLCALVVYGMSVLALSASSASSDAATLASTMKPTGAVLTTGTLLFPAGFMKSVKDYGATGNGTTDDTAAIQAALSDGRGNASGNYNGLPKGLYFPPGTYLVSKTLSWNGCCVTLQGAGPSASVIRLAPTSPGYGNANIAKALLSTPGGNESFRQNIWDIGFKIGPNNPGAVALDYISNNNGSIKDVSIVSEDGRGIEGIAMTRDYPGPLMLKNVSISGFQSGILTALAEYGLTIEGLTLQKQSVAGIYNQSQTISVRNLESTNSVPAIVNEGGFALVLDATLTGGSAKVPAIENTGNLYLRDITATGYEMTLDDTGISPAKTLTGTITEYVQGTPKTLFGDPLPHSLNLGVAETPSYVDPVLANWAPFEPTYYGDTASLQSLLDSGKSTIYFPFGAYFSYNETAVTVPDTVNRIVGFSSVVNGSTGGINGGGIRLIVDGDSTEPLVIEQFGYGMKIDHHGTRPVVIKSGMYKYTSFAGVGDLYMEDVTMPQLNFQPGQSVWARQLDDEYSGTKITNSGTLWVMGLKTEQTGTVINTTSGGSTELLGNLLYPALGLPITSTALQSTNAKVSYIYSQNSYCATCGYAVQVEETNDGTTDRLSSPQNERFVMNLFVDP
jgi:hypothetical protein